MAKRCATVLRHNSEANIYRTLRVAFRNLKAGHFRLLIKVKNHESTEKVKTGLYVSGVNYRTLFRRRLRMGSLASSVMQ
jgi:plasmid replication initiation protein